MILSNCHERVFSASSGVEQMPLGLHVVRGDSIAMLGELDVDLDAATDLSSVYADPIKALTH